ncbi:MAG: hypothetical protein JEY99_21055 [Spirochaetales bacterium]|nr:hypothetical protein [Spirochaetales bacterium]
MVESTSLRGINRLENSEAQADSSFYSGKSLLRNQYINAINYANFEGESLQVVFKHKIYARNLTIPATPSPCLNDSLELIWEKKITEEDLNRFDCQKILIPDRGGFLSAEPENYCLNPGGMTVALPEKAEILDSRKIGRYPGRGVDLTLIQSGSFYKGNLIDFNPQALLFILDQENNPGLRWVNRDETFQVILSKNNETFYSGECILTAAREDDGDIFHTAVILHSEIRKFRKKKFRGERFELPSPVYISFSHPLSKENCIIPVKDISGSGFRLVEEELKSVLIPGLIIPNLSLNLPGGMALNCKVQVIYRQKCEDENYSFIQCGMAILDMDPGKHALLLNFIHQENDSHAFVCNQVDTSSLWRFFFESG